MLEAGGTEQVLLKSDQIQNDNSDRWSILHVASTAINVSGFWYCDTTLPSTNVLDYIYS